MKPFALFMLAAFAGDLVLSKNVVDYILEADENVHIDLKDDEILVGDIKVNKNQWDTIHGKVKENVNHNSIVGDLYKWQSPKIPYVSTLSGAWQGALDAAIKEYQEKTCLKFVRRTDERDYIEFVMKSGCWSYVGRQGNKQQISLGNGCQWRSTAVHEIKHALGWWHEQSRKDRDDYVIINRDNIYDGMAYNFDKNEMDDRYSGPYDYASVMHYSKTAFSKNGLPTIVEKKKLPNGMTDFGQDWNGGLSEIDAEEVNAKYCSGKVTTTTTTRRTTPRTTTPRTTKRTTPRTTKQPEGDCIVYRPKSECVNQHVFCKSLRGWCGRNCWVRENCAETCNANFSRYCQRWVEKGYCETKKWVRRRCPQECGLVVCYEDNDDQEWW